MNINIRHWKICIGKRGCKCSNYWEASDEDCSFIGTTESLTHKVHQWECMTIPLKNLGNVDHHRRILRSPVHLGWVLWSLSFWTGWLCCSSSSVNLSFYFSSNSLKNTSQFSKWKHPAEQNIFSVFCFSVEKWKPVSLISFQLFFVFIA